MARSRVQSIRSNVSGARPASQEPGTIYTNWADRQIGVADSTRQPMDMVAVRYFATTASYTPGQLVVQNGKVYRAVAVISPSAFDPTKWAEITVQSGSGIWVGDEPRAEAPVQGQLLWESDSGDLFVWYEDADSGQWVQINVVGAVSQTVWLTRGQLITNVSAGFTVSDGVVVTVDGYQYIGETGATAIPDLPGLLPFGDVHVEHFGAVADLVWDIRTLGVYGGSSGTTGGNGPWKISGTDNRAKIQLANDYVTSAGIGQFFMEGGDYYSASQINLTSFMRSRNSFVNTLWARCSLLERGIFVNADNSGVTGLKLIGQYVRAGSPKPTSRGDLGCVITVNDIFLPVGAHRIRRNLEFDVRLCRAGLDVGPATQESNSSFLFFGAGGFEDSTFRLGVFGETNISSNGLLCFHWGLEYASGDPLGGSSQLPTVNSFHACDNRIEIVGDIDQIARPMGLSNIVFLSGIGTTEVSDISCRGVPSPVTVFPGDSGGAYIIPAQREKVMKGIRLGYLNARDVPLPSDVSLPASMWGTSEALFLLGSATDNVDKYTGVDRFITRQMECDIVMRGAAISRDSYPPSWSAHAASISHIVGRVDVGTITTYGFGRGIDLQHCHGEQVARYIEGDGSLYMAFNRGTRILDSRTDKGDTAGNAADGIFSPGYAADNTCVYAAGGSYPTVTTADAAVGAVKTMITPYVDHDIFIGDPVKIGPHWVTATDFISSQTTGLAGVNYILHTPLPAAVASGAAVTLDQIGRIAELVLSSSSGQYGLDAISVGIDRLDMSRLGWAGRHGVRLRSGSRAVITGLIPGTVGRMDPVASNNTISCDSTSFARIDNGAILANPRVVSTFRLSSGSVHLDKCRIEDVSTLVDPALTLLDKVRLLSMTECIDYATPQVLIAHPFRKGGADATGFYQCYDDGTLIQWLRNKVTAADGTYTWTFPMAFAATSSANVVASATSAVNPGFIQPAGSVTTTTAAIKAFNLAGAAAAIAFNAVATGRWYA